jgi:hypothetical protein
VKKPVLHALTVRFDLDQIGAALGLPPDDVQMAFRDGRGAWPFSEKWGERLFEFATHANTNMPSSDGAHVFERLGNLEVSVKALTRAGVKFQQSKDVGFGRTSTKDGLVAALEAVDRVIVVDITGFPDVTFYPIDSGRLISAVHNGVLTTSGWSPARLRDWVAQIYDLTMQKVVL